MHTKFFNYKKEKDTISFNKYIDCIGGYILLTYIENPSNITLKQYHHYNDNSKSIFKKYTENKYTKNYNNLTYFENGSDNILNRLVKNNNLLFYDRYDSKELKSIHTDTDLNKIIYSRGLS